LYSNPVCEDWNDHMNVCVTITKKPLWASVDEGLSLLIERVVGFFLYTHRSKVSIIHGSSLERLEFRKLGELCSVPVGVQPPLFCTQS
jgi:hypothetical protein